MEEKRLMQFSPGAGCGCKISPKDLEEILKKNLQNNYPQLLVGNESSDDAAVYDIGDNKAIISTTDFFTPIVDDAFTFGRIAAANAISDIYAMGGRPMMAIAILGWPLKKLGADLAKQVIEGARAMCQQASIPLAGGHSIDISDPIFGLAVTGIIDIDHLKKNNQATAGCRLFLTKPLGIGILSTAEKKGILRLEHQLLAIGLMTTLNNIGERYGKIKGVKAMTDVTGFGLLGHLTEMCEGSKLNAVINYDKLPIIRGIEDYIAQEAIPGGTIRNWKSYGKKIVGVSEEQKQLLCDPQTNGGLLVAVEPDAVDEFLSVSLKHGYTLHEIGYLEERNEKSKTFVEIV